MMPSRHAYAAPPVQMAEPAVRSGIV